MRHLIRSTRETGKSIPIYRGYVYFCAQRFHPEKLIPERSQLLTSGQGIHDNSWASGVLKIFHLDPQAIFQ